MRKPHWHRLRRDRLDLARAILFSVLGDVCAWCGSPDDPQVDHVDGRVGYQPRTLSATARLQRYFAEFRAGVRLRRLCKSCNSTDGRQRQLSRDAVVARVDRMERAA